MRRSRTVPMPDDAGGGEEQDHQSSSPRRPLVLDEEGSSSFDGNESLISMPLEESTSFSPIKVAAPRILRAASNGLQQLQESSNSTSGLQSPPGADISAGAQQRESISVDNLGNSGISSLPSAHGRSSSTMVSMQSNTSFSIEELKKSFRKPNATGEPSPAPSSFSSSRLSSKSSRLTIGRDSGLGGSRAVLSKNFDPDTSLLSLGASDNAERGSSVRSSMLPDLFSLEQALQECEEEEIKQELEILYAIQKEREESMRSSRASITKTPAVNKPSLPTIGWKTPFEVDAPKLRPNIHSKNFLGVAGDSIPEDSPGGSPRSLTSEQDAWAGIDALLDTQSQMGDSFADMSTTDILPKSVVKGIRRQNSHDGAESVTGETVTSSAVESSGISIGFTQKLANVTKRVSDESKRDLQFPKSSGKNISEVFQWSNKNNVDHQHNPNRKLNARKKKGLDIIQSSRHSKQGGDDCSLPSLASMYSEDVSTMSEPVLDSAVIIGDTSTYVTDRETFTIDIATFKKMYSKPDESSAEPTDPIKSSPTSKSKSKSSNHRHSKSSIEKEDRESRSSSKSSSSKKRKKKKRSSSKPLETMPDLIEEVHENALEPDEIINDQSPTANEFVDDKPSFDKESLYENAIVDYESPYEKASDDEHSLYEKASDDEESLYEKASDDEDEIFQSPHVDQETMNILPSSPPDNCGEDVKRPFLLDDDEDQPQLNFDPKVDEYIKQAQQKLPAFRKNHKKKSQGSDDDEAFSKESDDVEEEEEDPLEQLPSLTSLSSGHTSVEQKMTPTNNRDSVIGSKSAKKGSARKEEKKEVKASLGGRLKSLFSPGRKDKRRGSSVAERGDEKYFPKEVIDEAKGLTSNKCLLLQGDDGVNWN
jgi:hypothetical protein